jgi:uncharacterized protein YcaQ
MEVLDQKTARRLALVKAGLLRPDWVGLPRDARGRGTRARRAALAVIRRFGYLQLDTVSIAGARSHTIVLLARLPGLDARLGEELLRPGEPLFEYWGHEASWMPIEHYPLFGWRRRRFRTHPWWGDLIGRHPELVRQLRRRIERQGPLRSADLEGRGGSGWWELKTMKRVALALWSSGELAIRERTGFQRVFDLARHVIPDRWRRRRVGQAAALRELLLLALDGHGWAPTRTLVATWRLQGMSEAIRAALATLERRGMVRRCALATADGRRLPGWIQTADLELAARAARLRPGAGRPVLLSPFDPLLWDRARVAQLFDFEQVLEIFKPADRRLYGYFVLPVLAGERLVGRVDLKAERAEGRLRVLSLRYESTGTARPGEASEELATAAALERHAAACRLRLALPGAGP